MADPFCVFDWNNPAHVADPCLRAAELRRIYFERIRQGGSVKLVRTKSLDNEREAQFYNGGIDGLKAEMDAAIDECRAMQGLPALRRRYAITAGSRGSPRFIRQT